MKRFFKFSSIVLVFITAFMFGGCGAKATYDLNGKKFGKETTISSSDYLSTTEASSLNVMESETIEIIHFTSSSEIVMDLSIYKVKATVTSDNYYNKTTGDFYIETITTTTMGNTSNTSSKIVVGKNSFKYVYSGVEEKSIDEITSGYGEAYNTTNFVEIFNESLGVVEGTVEKSADLEDLVSKVTTQTTDSAIKYNFIFDSKNLSNAIKTYLNDTDFEDELSDLLDQTNLSNLKMSYYVIFLKDAEGNPADLIESNVDLSFKVTTKLEGATMTVKANVLGNFRIKEINEDVTFPF